MSWLSSPPPAAGKVRAAWPRRAGRLAITCVAVAAPTILLVSLFPADLMLAPTTAAGGDMGSHNYAATMSRELLWTRHRLTGWVPGNYAGFPLFQMYFPLPFVLMAALSVVVDPAVAFKLVSIAGVLALPAAAWFALARLGVPVPGPAVAASAVVLFLVQSGNTMWGGNLYSTLAGEFAYSISLPLALVSLGLYERARTCWRSAAGAGGLIALVALSHAYTVLWLALTWGIAAALHDDRYRSLLRVAAVFAGAGAICAFWLVPLLWYSPWTTAYQHLWIIRSLSEVLPPPLWPAVALTAGAPVLLAAIDRPALRAYWQTSLLLHAGLLAAALQYAVAPFFGIVDIRFLPFLQLMLCLLGAAAAGHLLSRWQAREIWVGVALLGALLAIQPERQRLDTWVRWNYEGFERKPLWPVYRAIADHLRGDAADPRVAFEHSPDHEPLGTVRAFENLPLFSGRSTLEGVNFQASVTAPFVFYVQSEISEVSSCPFAAWGCSRPNLAGGVEHLRMMHVSDLILRSETMKRAAAAHPDLERAATVGPYEVFRIRGASARAGDSRHDTGAAPAGASGHAVALDLAPYAVVTRDWKSAAYRWFKQARMADPVPVFLAGDAPPRGHPFATITRDAATPPPRVPLPHAPSLRERFEAERITIEGTRPGHPVLIRVSYHPRWRATTGEPVWLAGPGFMLVFPAGERLELVYSDAWPPAAGRIVSVAATGGALLMVAGARRGGGRRGGGRRRPPASAREAPEIRPRVALSLVVCAVLGAGAAGMYARWTNADYLYDRAQREFETGGLEEARRLFLRARERAPLSGTAIHASYFNAILLYREERWDEAAAAFRELVDRFPEAAAAAEALYHVGLCAERTGRTTDALTAFAETQQRFPGSMWADFAADRARTLRGS